MEQSLNKTEQEKIIIKILKDYFSKYAVKYYHEWRNSYFRVFNDDYLTEFFVQINPNGVHDVYHAISIYQVDDVLLEIGIPNMVLDTYLSKKHFLPTVLNRELTLTFNTEIQQVKTNFDCIRYCESIIQYTETDGKLFIERYSFLPNILKEINTLMDEGKYWHQGKIKLGQGYYTGLIISKLCNDPEYNNKFNYVMGLYSAPENNLTAYLPYLEKLKERLKTVEPIYNV